MKAVLLSIRPKWGELIASGKKTIEVRKTRPKLEAPFKVYIYCSKGNVKALPGKQKVIGEFVCDNIIKMQYNDNGYGLDGENGIVARSCVPANELYHYLQGAKPFMWHISALKIYDKPHDISLLSRARVDTSTSLLYSVPVSRPPQSWCYVEEAPACSK